MSTASSETLQPGAPHVVKEELGDECSTRRLDKEEAIGLVSQSDQMDGVGVYYVKGVREVQLESSASMGQMLRTMEVL